MGLADSAPVWPRRRPCRARATDGARRPVKNGEFTRFSTTETRSARVSNPTLQAPEGRQGEERSILCPISSPAAFISRVAGPSSARGTCFQTMLNDAHLDAHRVADIAVAIVVHGERVCRSSAQHHRQLALGGLRFFSTSASVIIIIIGSTGHS